MNNTINKYNELTKLHGGEGRTIALKLKDLPKEDLFYGMEKAFETKDVSMKNCFIMALAFKKNNITS
jgi:hypothetical protein